MKLEKSDILNILPQRPPILLVDSALITENGTAQAELYVDPEWDIFRGHFPGAPVLPGVYLIESMAQTADLLLLLPEENRGRLPVFMGVKQMRFIRPVKPGSHLYMTAEPVQESAGIATYRVSARTSEGRAAAGQIELILK